MFVCVKMHFHLLFTFEGTIKRKGKELHGTANIRALSGAWGDKLDDAARFFAYKLEFACRILSEIY